MKLPIVFLVPGLSVGGAERHTVDLRQRLTDRGIETALIVYGRRRSDVILSHPGARDAIFLDLPGMSDLRGWLIVRRELRRLAPGIILGVNQTPLIVAAVTRLLGGTPAQVGCIFHTTILRRSERRRLFLFRWALRLSDVLIYVSANQKRYWEERRLTCRRQEVILNGVDLSLFDGAGNEGRGTTRRKLGFDDADCVIGMVAAFRPEKNHRALIEALHMLRAKGVPAKALLVGDGETLSTIQMQTDQLGLGDYVVFAGEQSDVRPFIAACDIGLLCSNAVETFSLSALEFLAMNVPMVMSRIGGASEIIEDGVNGFLFEANDMKGMVARLEMLSNSTTRNRLAEGTRRSLERLSIESMVDRYIEVLGKLPSQRAMVKST